MGLRLVDRRLITTGIPILIDYKQVCIQEGEGLPLHIEEDGRKYLLEVVQINRDPVVGIFWEANYVQVNKPKEQS